MSAGADALSFQVARVRLQLMLLLSLALPLPVHVRARISEPGGHPSGEGWQSHGLGSERRHAERIYLELILHATTNATNFMMITFWVFLV